MIGKTLRFRRLIDESSGRTFIVAIDHGIFMGPLQGIERIGKLVEKLSQVDGVNGFLLTPGVLKHVASLLGSKKAVVLRIDGATTLYSERPYDNSLLRSILSCLSMGADAVVAMGYVGTGRDNITLRNLALLAEQCDSYGVPLIAEMIPVKSESIPDPHDPKVIAYAARIGSELGADIIKTLFTGSKETFRRVVESCPSPIAVAGGPKMGRTIDVLVTAKEAVEAGAIGIIFGRNVWQHPDPRSMALALSKVIHEDMSPEEAYSRYLSKRLLPTKSP